LATKNIADLAPEIPFERTAFERALTELVRTQQAQKDSPTSYKAYGSERCISCTFVTNCSDCFKCTYCTFCARCSDCTQCRECADCHTASYCVRSQHCYKSSYLILSQHCYECVFCFGCVGLFGEEFCILNKRYRRDVYFKIVAELKVMLGIS
jgi:hypothetical protein